MSGWAAGRFEGGGNHGSVEAGEARWLAGRPGFDGVTTVDPGAESSMKADECGLSRNGEGEGAGEGRAGLRWMGGGVKDAGGGGGGAGWFSHGEAGGVAAGGGGMGAEDGLGLPAVRGAESVKEISDSSQANSVANLEGASCSFEASVGETLGRKLELPAAAVSSTICSGVEVLAVAGEVNDNNHASVE